MKKTTWVILGATSIIAEEFARVCAQQGCALLLVGRDNLQLTLIADDLRLRYHIQCEILQTNFSEDSQMLINQLMQRKETISLFIAYSYLIDNSDVTSEVIENLVKVNVLSTLQLIHAYMKKIQTTHRIIFLSSVAACRGRAKNSLYGASKQTISTYLEGIQQQALRSQTISIIQLGFIDTVQTFGHASFAASPKDCAKACWEASMKGKRQIYFPFFWRYIMVIIKNMPFSIYQKMKKL